MPRKPRARRPPESTTLVEVETQLTSIRARLAATDVELNASQRTGLTRELRSWMKLRVEIEQKQALTEDKISQHPRWLSLRDGIVNVIADCPHCADAVGELLR